MSKPTKKSAASIRARLLNIAKERKISFQDLLNRFGAEQFLARLAMSSFSERFIFKGGSLLAYLIDTNRQTKDLDFSIRQVSNKVEDALEVVRSIIAIPMEDELTWDPLIGTPLVHPEMELPGVRIKCTFNLDTARGHLQMDLALGDLVEARKILLERIQYRGEALIGPDFKILAYPPETIFSEKLQIAIKRAGKNTRMKDYYDMFKLCQVESLEPALIKSSIEKTFAKRSMEVPLLLAFDNAALGRLQLFWSGFIRKAKITDAPDSLNDVIKLVNKKIAGHL